MVNRLEAIEPLSDGDVVTPILSLLDTRSIASIPIAGRLTKVLNDLPAAIYTTDAKGHITFFNKAAVGFSGRTPQIGSDKWCVSWKLRWPDGTSLPHDQCPMALSLQQNRPIRGTKAVAERPDGSSISFAPFPTPLRNDLGEVVGGLNILIDLEKRRNLSDCFQQRTALDMVDFWRMHGSPPSIVAPKQRNITRKLRSAVEQLMYFDEATIRENRDIAQMIAAMGLNLKTLSRIIPDVVARYKKFGELWV